MRVQDGVCLLREGRVQSVREQLDRLCSRWNLFSKGRRKHEPQSSLDEEKKIRVFCECRAQSVGSARVPTGSV